MTYNAPTLKLLQKKNIFNKVLGYYYTLIHENGNISGKG